MRCVICGWAVESGRCRCGASVATAVPGIIPVGERVLARAGRGPSMERWDRGEIEAHVGFIHRVATSFGVYWCEPDDILADSPRREELFVERARVWGLWLDGRWYPGTVDGIQGPLRHVTFDDDDRMWTEARNLVVMAVESPPPRVGKRVLAPRWDGQYDAASVEQTEGGRYRVAFEDGDEAWFGADDLKTFPPNPFLDAGP